MNKIFETCEQNQGIFKIFLWHVSLLSRTFRIQRCFKYFSIRHAYLRKWMMFLCDLANRSSTKVNWFEQRSDECCVATFYIRCSVQSLAVPRFDIILSNAKYSTLYRSYIGIASFYLLNRVVWCCVSSCNRHGNAKKALSFIWTINSTR